MLDASNLSASEIGPPIYTEVSLKFSNRLGNSGMDSQSSQTRRMHVPEPQILQAYGGSNLEIRSSELMKQQQPT